MIARLRGLLGGTDLRRRLAAVPGTLPASTVVSITLDLYSHVLDSMQAEAAEQIGDVVFGR